MAVSEFGRLLKGARLQHICKMQ